MTQPHRLTARRRSSVAALLGSVVFATAATACTAAPPSTAPSQLPSQPSSSTAVATTGTSTNAPAAACSPTVRSSTGDAVTVSVRGSVTCAQAHAVAAAYYRDAPTKGQGSSGQLQVAGFTCASTPGDVAQSTGDAGSCSRTAAGGSSPYAEILLRTR